MSWTSQKHSNFVSEPMGRKPVTDLAGVGKAVGGNLLQNGYSKASNVFGEYLVRGGDESSFKQFMKEAGGSNSKQSGDTYRCLKQWSNEFL